MKKNILLTNVIAALILSNSNVSFAGRYARTLTTDEKEEHYLANRIEGYRGSLQRLSIIYAEECQDIEAVADQRHYGFQMREVLDRNCQNAEYFIKKYKIIVKDLEKQHSNVLKKIADTNDNSSIEYKDRTEYKDRIVRNGKVEYKDRVEYKTIKK